MFDGKRFLPLTGTPIPKMLFSSTLLADCEPDPFTVATLMLKSLITRLRVFVAPCASSRAKSPVAMWRDSLQKNSVGRRPTPADRRAVLPSLRLYSRTCIRRQKAGGKQHFIRS